MTESSQNSPSQSAASFEKALEELENIVQLMEEGAMSLEDSLTAYQRGMALLKSCQSQLTAAEQKIRMLENGVMQDLPPEAGDETS